MVSDHHKGKHCNMTSGRKKPPLVCINIWFAFHETSALHNKYVVIDQGVRQTENLSSEYLR